MSDFITMQCPSCGGNLTIGNNALSLKCEHCGAEHMIRREAGGIILESYARCPVCNRNDKAEKITAILRSQMHNSQGITYQTRTTMVHMGNAMVPVTQQVAIPIQTSQMSELAKHLASPSKPQPNMNIVVRNGPSHFALISAILTAILGIILLLGTLVVAIGSMSSSTDALVFTLLICCPISLTPLGVSALLFIFAVPRERKNNQEKEAIYANKRHEFQLQADEQLKRWNLAMDRWNKLYYCGRDDCVFLPGTNTSAPISNMLEYLYQS